MFSAHHGLQILQLLLDHGADVNLGRTSNGNTPLHLACTYSRRLKISNIKVIKFLVFNGADLSAVNSDGATPLLDTLKDSSKGSSNEEVETKTIQFLLEHSNFEILNSKGNHILSIDLVGFKWKMVL